MLAYLFGIKWYIPRLGIRNSRNVSLHQIPAAECALGVIVVLLMRPVPMRMPSLVR